MSDEIVEQTPEQIATEKEARAFGWVPQGEYRDGEHYVDAETFVKRGKEINPILRKNNEALLKKLEASQNEIVEIRKVAKEFEAFQKDNATKKVAELQHELDDLKERKKEAVSSGNGDAVVAIDDAIDIVKDQQREAKKPVEPEPEKKPVKLEPELVEWMDENKWFTYDEKYTKIADAIGVDLSKKNPGLRGKAFFEKLDEELSQWLPDEYKKPTRRNPVEGASGASRPSGSKNSKSYASLPQDAKDACDRMVKSKLLTKEAYVATYYEND